MTGFSFNGIHSSVFGLYYIPNADDKWFSDPEYDVYDIDVGWKNGGYYFDSKTKNRTFTIKCFFEEIDIGTRQRIKQWVKRGTRGILAFDDMPFVYWNVVPGKIPVGNWYLDTGESHSGTVTFTFTAYEPFGYLTRKSNSAYDTDDGWDAYCNFISNSDMPAAPLTTDTSFEVYNPGTEECGLGIDISGTTSNPIRLYNDTNGTFCILNSLPSSGKHLHIDGNSGYIYEYTSGSTDYTNGFAHHDKGIIKLSPNKGFSDVNYIYHGSSSGVATFELVGTVVSRDMIGGILTVVSPHFNTIYTVTEINEIANRLYCTWNTGSTPPASSATCRLIKTNHIYIQEKSGSSWAAPSSLELSSIEVDYNPRIS